MIRVVDGATGDPIIDRAIGLQTSLQNTIVSDDPVAFAIGAAAVLAMFALVVATFAAPRPASASSPISIP